MVVTDSKKEGTTTATICSYCGRSLEYPYVSQPGVAGRVLGFHPICAGTFGALLSSDYLELVKVAIVKGRLVE